MNLYDYTKRLLLLTLILSLALVTLPNFGSALAAEPAKAGISLDFKNVELTDLVKTISELTGRNFVYDERVRGKVTIISPETMSKDAAYQLFLSVLNIKGYTIVPSGKVNKIVPLQNARVNNLPVSNQQRGENYVTRLIHLKYAAAQTLVTTVLRPLIAKTGNLSVYAPSNTLILTDSAANIERLYKIIKRLDVPSRLAGLQIFTLKQADAEVIAKIANALLKNLGQRERTNRKVAIQIGQVIAYPRTNTLVAIASTAEISLLRNLIKTLDTPQNQARSNINVYYLKNADAEELAKTLNEIMTGAKRVVAKGKNKAATQGPVVITADKPTNSLLINAGPEDYALLSQVIAKLDIQRNQVYVEALILELSMNATREIGASLQGAAGINGQSVVLGSSNLNTGSVGLSDLLPSTTGDNQLPSLLAKTVQGLMLGGLFNPVTTTLSDGTSVTVPAISALIQLSQTSDDVNVLSAPRLLTSDNEEAEIIVGSNVPIITSRLTDTGGSSSLAQSVTVERKDVALTLRFTPQVTEGNQVRLNVFQEITNVASENDNTGPTLTKRQLRNTVLAEDGKTVVLGGLIGTNVQHTSFKVPLLGDIPLLGRLFRSSGTTTKKTNLLIFITPRVIHNASEMSKITSRARLIGQEFQTKELKKSLNKKALMMDLDSGEDKGEPLPK